MRNSARRWARPAGRSLWVVAVLLTVTSLWLPRPARAEGAKLAELPHWPVGLPLPEGLPTRRPPKADKASILVWTPPEARRIRAMLLIVANTDSKHFGEHDALRKVAARHGMGIVYFRYPVQSRAAAQDEAGVAKLFDVIADATGIAEFRHAPWITFGKSSMGKFPYYMAWYKPERTIATISYHAETPKWPMEGWAKPQTQTIFHVNANGETEWGGTWNRHVRPSLLNYRANTAWLPHILVAHNVGHGDYSDAHGSEGWRKPVPADETSVQQVWDYLSLFVDKALTYRLPADGYPTAEPLVLRQVDEEQGFVVDPFAIEDLYERPRFPLVKEEGAYVVNPPQPPAEGFAAIPPAADYRPPEDVPVNTLQVGQGPVEWLISDGLRFAMENDPLKELGELASLRVQPGDTIKIDGREAAFHEMTGRWRRDKGGLKLGGNQRSTDFTMVAYSVLKVPQDMEVKINVPHTQTGRVQLVLNGQPVAHQQVVGLKKGLYPAVLAIRLEIKWQHVSVGFEAASDKEVAAAKEFAVELERKRAELAAMEASNQKPPPVIRRAADVPEAQRRLMFWLPDREMVEAWFEIHAVKGQKLKEHTALGTK